MNIYLVVLEVAPIVYLVLLNGPLVAAEEKSFEKFIRSTVDLLEVADGTAGKYPPPNQP